ncbi:MAG: hypothetical protein ABI882_07930 [Acidobacteriota bacterium]
MIISEGDARIGGMAGDNEHVGAARQEHLWMVALYEREERTGELLDRLGALGIDTGEATIVRVELNDAASAASALSAKRSASHGTSSVSPIARHALTGAIIGSSVVLLIGLLLYSAGLLNLGFVEGMFAHALVSAVAGAVLGAAIGAALAPLVHRSPPPPAVPDWARLNRDGFLVAIKMPPGLAQQAEEIARRLGAKEILL